MIDQTRAPLWEALKKHISRGNFHVPGHKAGQVFDKEGRDRFDRILSIDVTEVGDLDDLHAASGVIREAEFLAAAAFGADATRFLVGGTTAGNLAVIMALCKPNDMVLVARSCHQSIYHGCLLAGAQVVPIPYEIDPQTGMEMPMSSYKLEQLLDTYPNAKGVVVTNPSYFGIVQPINQLAEIAHERNIPLIVDEAHGAHFGFHSSLPKSALNENADVVIQSTHKMLTSLTMSSMLHIKGSLMDLDVIDSYLRIVQSSSPSYPLMASLDLARRQIVLEGTDKLDQVLKWLVAFRNRLKQYPDIQELTLTSPMDPFKLTVTLCGYTGYELVSMLEQRGIYAELADYQKVLFAFSLATNEEELDYLHKQLGVIQQELPKRTKVRHLPLLSPIEGEVISYAECRIRKRYLLPIEQAVGKRSAVHLVPYPPGIPLVLMGEVIQQECIDYLLSLIELGGNVRGLKQKNDTYLLSVYN